MSAIDVTVTGSNMTGTGPVRFRVRTSAPSGERLDVEVSNERDPSDPRGVLSRENAKLFALTILEWCGR